MWPLIVTVAVVAFTAFTALVVRVTDFLVSTSGVKVTRAISDEIDPQTDPSKAVKVYSVPVSRPVRFTEYVPLSAAWQGICA